MHELDDNALLRQYAEQNSEPAFATLVARHVDKVYSAVLRHTRNAHAAEEITQAVFVILAKKSGRLGAKVILAGWLYETARLTAVTFIRSEIRRAHREQEAHMQTALNKNADDPWPHIAPLLDDALAKLSEADRHAVVLRFFDGKSLGEVGAALGASEDAAKKRVTRAVEKLRGWFTKRGVTLTATVLTAAISANSVQAAPLGLAKTISVIAIAKGATAGGSTLALVKGALKIMAWTKMKMAIAVGVGVLLAVGTTSVVIQHQHHLTPQEIAKQSQDAYAALSSYSDNGTAISEVGGENSKTTFATRLSRPNLYRIDWTQTTKIANENGILWSDGRGNFMAQGSEGKEKTVAPQKMTNAKQAFGICAAVSGLGSCTIAETFFDKNWSDSLTIAASGKFQIKKENDEPVGGVNCHVFSYTVDPAKFSDHGKLPNNMGKIGISTTTIWIGKHDRFIHQIRTSMEGMSLAMPRQSDDNIKAILERQNKPATPEAIATWRAQMDAMMKQAQVTKYVSTQTHENIVVNQKFSPADFAR